VLSRCHFFASFCSGFFLRFVLCCELRQTNGEMIAAQQLLFIVLELEIGLIGVMSVVRFSFRSLS